MSANLQKILLTALFAVFSLGAFASHDENASAEEPFNPGELILHHVADSYEWHIAGPVAIPLPVILYSSEKGLSVFMSSAFHHGAAPAHGGDEAHGQEPEATHGTTHDENAIVTATVNGYGLDHHGHIRSEDGSSFVDLSITKNVASLFVSIGLMFFIFLSIAGYYKKNGAVAPKGLASLFEPIIIFLRDEVVKPSIGPKYATYLPYMLTLFFFIWFNNVLGLLPGWANLTGNIAVTMTLALLTFFITNGSANKDYWAHIYNTPGVPWWLKFPVPLMPVVEFIGVFTKPFSLMIRLFANITAGHIIILSLLSLTFLFKSYAIGVAASVFSTALMCLEVVVALIQAYLFTLLSSIYIGSAVAEHHHDEHEHAHAEHH